MAFFYDLLCRKKNKEHNCCFSITLQKKIANLLEIIYLLIAHYFWKKILEKWKRQMRLSLWILLYKLLNGTKVGKRLPTHRTHMWRKSRSPSTVSKSPPLPLKGSPFPSQNTLPLPPPPFSYKSLLLSRERKATGIYIIKISLDIQRSLRGFSNRFKISVRLGWYTIL